jgi:hypothetical protein
MEDQSSAEIRVRLRHWRQEHPQASFDEIEDAVQAEVVRWQAQLVAEVMGTGRPDTELAAAAAAAGGGEETAPVCAGCGGPMQRSGQRTRMLLSRLGQPIPLERAYFVCPACGAGLFPPG